ncbi:hypothetical protein NADFUDRAFT_82696, partial [Nadsonia fulvescens var. elongata DSM 6958]
MSGLAEIFAKLSLESNDLVEVTNADLTPNTDLNDLQKAEADQWLTLSLADRAAENVAALNSVLASRTFLLNTPSATIVDLTVAKRVLALVQAMSDEDRKANRHVVRWVDLIQHTVGITEVEINVDLEAPREIKAKEKKESKEAPAQEGAKKEKKAKAPAAATEAPSAVDADAAKKEKKDKKDKKKKEQPAKVEVPVSPTMIDFRVGHIQKAIKHPDADSLYVSTIDMGDEEGPRTVCSGLVKYFPIEAMQGRMVVVVANLKPVNMRGIKSTAMVLCASDENTVQFVNPPAGAKAGDKVFFESYDGVPEKQLN